MSTLKTNAITSRAGSDLSLSGDSGNVVDIEAGFKVGGVAGIPTASIRDDAVTTAKILNANVTAAKLAAGVQNDVFWDVYGTTDQTGITANAITTAVFDTVADQSSHGGYATGTGLFTVPSGYGGMYFITGFASIDGVSGAALRSMYGSIYINSTAIGRPGYFVIDNSFEGTQTSATQVSCVTQVDAGETIGIRVQAYANNYNIKHSRSLSGFYGFRVIAN